MSDGKYQNIAIGLLALTALIMLLFQKSEGQTKMQGFIALAIILGISLVFPFVGMLLAVPIALVAWFDHQKEIWGWWEKQKNNSLNISGDWDKKYTGR